MVACRDELKARRTSSAKGVSFSNARRKWQAAVYIKQLQPGVPSKPVALGLSVTEQQAAERVSAASYILGDRCGSGGVC